MMFEALQHGYMQNAVLAGLCAGIGCSIAGVFVVTMHLSLLSVCIAHAAFAGALLGILIGVDPLVTAIVFSLVTSAIVGPLADRGELSPDASVGVIFSLMLGLAFLFLGMMPDARTEALSLFWGNILYVGRGELLAMAAVSSLLVCFLALFYKEVRAVLCHRQVALQVGVHATAVFYAMIVATGITIATSLSSIGGLLIYSLVLNPAAAAYQLTYRLTWLFILAAVFGVLSCWAGLATSYLWDLPAGASIVIVSSGIFGLATWLSPKRRSAR